VIDGPRWALPLGAPTPGASFTDLLDRLGLSGRWDPPPLEGGRLPGAPEGTTVLALRYADGVIMAGDRQATEGNLVAHKSIQKVFGADHYSAVAIAGTAGLALEMVHLFQVELEHYEKIEGIRLSLDGKANYLARLVRSQLPMAFQGLVVVPLFAGYDERAETGRLYSFDVVGGRYEEQEFASTGSGSRLAKSYLRTVWRQDLGERDALDMAVEALVAAAQEDTATGGPDLQRGILPTVVVIDAEGVRDADPQEVHRAAVDAIEAVR
jgi:proteasome beta subunit